ncbi:MAG TPA: zinc ribbon domain-containing protein [Nitrososphaerales archaeon]|nr:zinc ribbon domain-containing protein [Nitrososphaerales archaeon]
MHSKITLMSSIMLLALGAIGALFFRFNPFSSSSSQNLFITLGLSFIVVVITGVILIRPALGNNKTRLQPSRISPPKGGITSNLQPKISTLQTQNISYKSDPNPSLTSQRKPMVPTGLPTVVAKSVPATQTGPIMNAKLPRASVETGSAEVLASRQITQSNGSAQVIQKMEAKHIPTPPLITGEPRNFVTPSCTFCGRSALPNANFCHSCGSPLNQLWSGDSMSEMNTPISNASGRNPSSQSLYYEEIRRLRESSERFEKLADRFTKLGYLLAAEAGVIVLIVIIVFG